MKCYEVNFDALVGPTHNYSGLPLGNVASQEHKMAISNPRLAALQGLEKMKFLHSLGIKQGIIPPQPRPHFQTLRDVGFQGNNFDILRQAWAETPDLVRAVSSSAFMWAANSATITPSCDSSDGRVQFTPANLSSNLHRSIEAECTAKLLREIFPDPAFFKHHPPLPHGCQFSDEGAANHSCFNRTHGSPGVHLFVYGRSNFASNVLTPKLYPARQSLEASQAIGRLHQVESALFFQQNPQAIDAGVFHNDVISVGNNNVFLYHELAFVDSAACIEQLRMAVLARCNTDLFCIKVRNKDVSIQDAVKSYLFNSQLVTLPDGSMSLIAPTDCQMNPAVSAFLKALIEGRTTPIQSVHFLDLRQSMQNGGGPACLRLRVALTERELQAVNPLFLFNEELYASLTSCIQKYYPTEVSPRDLLNTQFLEAAERALEAVYQIFSLQTLFY